MHSKIRSFFLSLTIIAVLLFSAIGTTTVYADDGTPGDTSVTQTSGDDSSEGEETPDVELTATEEPAVSEDAAATETPAADAASGDEGSSSEEETPDVEPTATEEPAVSEDTAATETPAADAANGDEGSSSEEATSTDTPATDTADVVPTTEETAPPADTSILEQVPENTTVAVLDANGQAQPLATAESAAAIAVTSDPIWCPAAQTTPTPGANGCTASFTSFTDLLNELSNNPTTYQGAGTIYVQQGQYAGGESVIDFNSFNLSNISNSNLTVQGGWNTVTNVVDPASTSNFNVSIIIGSSTNPWGGSLTIDNIIVDGSSATGLTVYSNANVTITDSNFQRNREKGAEIHAGGNVAIQNSNFSNPGTNRLQRIGLDINSAGSVSLLDVIADGNREAGAIIVADGRVSIGTFTGTTSFSGTKSTTTTTCPGSPSQFCGFGLQVTTLDSIDLQGVIGNDNFLWGANLNAGQDVNIVDSIFNANSTEVPTFIDDTGLFITAGGTVNLNNVTANDNRLFGASIDAVGDVSVNNSNFLSNNGVTVTGSGTTQYDGIGLQVNSDGAIFINNTNATGNSLFGANLTAVGDVAIANSTFSTTTTGVATAPLGVGLSIVSGQNVFIDTVTLDGNQVSGATIQAASDVFLDFVTATNNGKNGVEVDAACTHLNGGTYTGNTEYGLSLVNPVLDVVSPSVFSGNGLGDIFPAVTNPCPVAVIGGGNTGGGTIGIGTGNGLFSGSTSSNQTISLATANYSTNKNLGLINSGAITLDNLFAGNYQLIGVSTSPSGKVTTLGIFTGKYAYIHSAGGLQIVILLQPTIFSGVWSSDQS